MLLKAALFQFQKYQCTLYLCKPKRLIMKPLSNCLSLFLLRQPVLFHTTTVRKENKKYLMKFKKKANTLEAWKWEDREQPMQKNECMLAPEVLVNLDHSFTPLQ